MGILSPRGTRTIRSSLVVIAPSLSVYVYVCMCKCECICACMHECICVCMCDCMCVRIDTILMSVGGGEGRVKMRVM